MARSALQCGNTEEVHVCTFAEWPKQGMHSLSRQSFALLSLVTPLQAAFCEILSVYSRSSCMCIEKQDLVAIYRAYQTGAKRSLWLLCICGLIMISSTRCYQTRLAGSLSAYEPEYCGIKGSELCKYLKVMKVPYRIHTNELRIDKYIETKSVIHIYVLLSRLNLHVVEQISLTKSFESLSIQ